MWILAFGIYAGCKSLTWMNTTVRHAPAWKHAAYLFAWPGLDATGFLERLPRARCELRELLTATGRIVAGGALLFGLARMLPPQYPYVVGWIGMIGIVLLLHFGVFQLLSCVWRSAGVDARPLMNHPLASTSLSEFWGKRWNTAFRDLAHRFLFRPLSAWYGPRLGLVAGFIFSGAVHDVVISLPAHGGYGGPTLYFAMQGSAILFERCKLGRRIGLGSGRVGRAFAALILVGPVFLLFHRPFVVEVIVPFMRAIGALL